LTYYILYTLRTNLTSQEQYYSKEDFGLNQNYKEFNLPRLSLENQDTYLAQTIITINI